MFRRKPVPDVIGGGYRFAVKNTRQSLNLEHIPIPSGTGGGLEAASIAGFFVL
jgi:hypothetical protein